MYDVDGFLYTFFIKDERSHVSLIAIWLARIKIDHRQLMGVKFLSFLNGLWGRTAEAIV
jgi:hypothetical protein